MIINTGFFDRIAAKYNVSGQRRRRFPPLTFLVMRHPLTLQLPMIKNTNIYRSNSSYYLNQNLFFNIDLFARATGKSQLLLKKLLKIAETIPPTSKESNGKTKTPRGMPLTFFTAIISPTVARVPQKKEQTIHHPGEGKPSMPILPHIPSPRFKWNQFSKFQQHPSSPFIQAASYRSYESQTEPPGPRDRGKTLPENEPVPDVHNAHNVHNVHNTRNSNIYPSAAVFKSSPSIAVFTPASVSNNFNTHPLFFTRFMDHTPIPNSIPGQRDKAGSAALSKSTPTLDYSSSLRLPRKTGFLRSFTSDSKT